MIPEEQAAIVSFSDPKGSIFCLFTDGQICGFSSFIIAKKVKLLTVCSDWKVNGIDIR